MRPRGANFGNNFFRSSHHRAIAAVRNRHHVCFVGPCQVGDFATKVVTSFGCIAFAERSGFNTTGANGWN
jgi:hypothetical protein